MAEKSDILGFDPGFPFSASGKSLRDGVPRSWRDDVFRISRGKRHYEFCTGFIQPTERPLLSPDIR